MAKNNKKNSNRNRTNTKSNTNKNYKKNNTRKKTNNTTIAKEELIIEKTTKNNEAQSKKKITKKESNIKEQKITKEYAKQEPVQYEEKITIQEVIKEEEKTRKGIRKNVIIIILLIIFLIALVSFFAYKVSSDTFKEEIYIEIGTDNVAINDFFDKKVMKNSSIVTDMSSIDLKKLGDYKVEIKIGRKSRESIIHVVDTTSPIVEFKDVETTTAYEFDPNDFIVSKEDFTEMTVEAENIPAKGAVGELKVTIIVKDTSGNETRDERTLYIGALKPEYQLELGTKLKKTDILYNEENEDAISTADINAINKKGVGTYTIDAVIDGKKFTSKIIIKDTKGPVIKTKNVTIYDDEKPNLTIKNFVSSITDASSYTSKLVTEITQYGKVGSHKIVIEATDAYGNKSTATATLTIRKDTVGPVFSGLSDITIKKNSSYDFKKGVKAVDAKDGTVEFTVDTSALKVNTTGTYYITYTAKDKAGNKTTKKRKVTVSPDHADVQNKVNSVAKGIGNSIKDINNYVSKHIYYRGTEWGGKTYDTAVWQGLTQGHGNCYVYAQTYYALLTAKGYKAEVVHTFDETHYWVMVYDPSDGKWWHSDAQNVPPLVKGTDKQMAGLLAGREWDKSKWSTEK